MKKQNEKKNFSLPGRIFAPEGELISVLDRFSDLVILNVLCILCSLPIITAGSSISAACSCSFKMQKKEGGSIFKEFRNAWKRDWMQVMPVWLIMLCLLFLFFTEYQITAYMPERMRISSRCILTIAMIFWLSVSVYLFPLLALFQTTRRQSFKNAAKLAVANFPWTVLMLFIVLIPYLMLHLIPGMLAVVLLFLLILGVEGIIMINCIIFNRSIIKQGGL